MENRDVTCPRMRKLRLYRYGGVEDSKPELGLSLKDGKYNAERLDENMGREYNLYIALSRQSLYLVDVDKKAVVLKNNWTYETGAWSDCMFGDNFRIETRLILGAEEIRVTTHRYGDFVDVLLGVSENCKNIAEAKQYVEGMGLHNSPEYPDIYHSAPV